MTDDNQNREQVKKTVNSSDGIEDVMLEVAWKDYSTSAEDKRALDSKANMILVASGVLLGLIVNGISIMNTALAILAVIILIFVGIFCILALNIRTYSGLGTMKTWDALKAEKTLDDPIQSKKNIMATIDEAVKQNREQAKSIVAMIKPANYLFIVALVIVAVAVVLNYVSALCATSG